MTDDKPLSVEPNEREWDVFLCYRRDDGEETTAWLFKHLNGQPVSRAAQTPSHLRLYMDQHAAAVSNWRELNRNALRRARAMILICTPGAAIDFGPKDELQAELRWWIEHRTTAPILVDALGRGERYVPPIIKERWPDAQLAEVRLSDWAKEEEAERKALGDRAVARIREGILLSEHEVRDEELEQALRLHKEMETALAEAEIQRNIASAALMAAQGELLIEDGVLETAQCGALVVVESLKRVPTTLQGHRAWARVMSFFPPLLDCCELPEANRAEAISIGRDGHVVAVGSASSTTVLDVMTGSTQRFSHQDLVEAVALDPTGMYLATRSQKETVRVWDLKSKELDHEWPENEISRSLRFDQSGTLLASCDFVEPMHIRLWRPVLKREEPALLSFEPVSRLCMFSAENDYLVAIVDHGQLEETVVVAWKLTEPGRGRLASYLKGDGLVDAAFSADLGLIATCGFRHAEVRPFNREGAISSPTNITRLRDRRGRAIVFHPHGGYLALATLDRVRLWDFRSEREVGSIDHPKVQHLAFNLGGDVLTTVTSNEVRRWDVACGRTLAGKVQSEKKPLSEDEINAMIPSTIGRIGRELTSAERAEFLTDQTPPPG